MIVIILTVVGVIVSCCSAVVTGTITKDVNIMLTTFAVTFVSYQLVLAFAFWRSEKKRKEKKVK